MNGEEGITDLVRGCILPLQEKHAELFKKEGGVFKKDLDVFKNPQGLFATYSASCLFVKCTYASGHTYVRIVSGGGMLGRICHSKHFIHKLFGTILFFLFVYSRDFSNFAP